VSPTQLTGTGTVNTSGLITDGVLTFDSTHGVNQTLLLQGPSQNVVVDLTLSPQVGLLGVGYLSSGTMTITDGLAVTCSEAILGYALGATGVATVSGSGSVWNTELTVGNNGSGSLSIVNGGTLKGSLSVGLAGGPASSSSVLVAGAQSQATLFGLNIGNGGTGLVEISDGAVISTPDTTIGGSPGGDGTLIVDGANSLFNSTKNGGDMAVAYEGTGHLIAQNGGTYRSTNLIVGQMSGSNGTVRADGVSSSATADLITVGDVGFGTLEISNGGQVTLTGSEPYGPHLQIAKMTGGTGVVRVDGMGSELTGSYGVQDGTAGQGVLVATNGAAINTSVNVAAGSVAEVDNLSLVDGISNAGTVLLLATSHTNSGNFQPIQPGNPEGSVPYAAVGGVWNDAGSTFTVAPAVTTTPGNPITLDRAVTQRVVITDTASSSSAGISLLSAAGSSTVSVSASPASTSDLNSLQNALAGSSVQVLSAWQFSATNYNGSEPAYISIPISSPYNADLLTVFHFDGTTWMPLTNVYELNTDGAYANFTASADGEYAIVVPEPIGFALLSFAGVILRRRRRASHMAAIS
jgi:T5SS/PEP-CTERM-associated repeat protein